MSTLLLVWLVSCVGSCLGQVLRFDVTRASRSTSMVSKPVCARLTCSVHSDNVETEDMVRVLSLEISDETDPTNVRRLAGLSAFDIGVNIYGDPSAISGSGHLSALSGVLNVELLDQPNNCSDITFSCQVRYESKTGNYETHKKIKRGNKVKIPPPSLTPSRVDFLNSPVLAEINSQISAHLGKAMDYLQDMTEAIHGRLGKIEYTLYEHHQRAHPVEWKLNQVEEKIMSELRNKVGHVVDKLATVSGSMNQITDRLDVMHQRSERLEDSLANVSTAVGQLLSQSSSNSLPGDQPCEQLHGNVSVAMLEGLNIISEIKAEIMDRLSSLENSHNNSLDVQMLHVLTLVKSEFEGFEKNYNRSLHLWLSNVRSEFEEKLRDVERRFPNASQDQLMPYKRVEKAVIILANNVKQLTSRLNQTDAQLQLMQQNMSALQGQVAGQHKQVTERLDQFNENVDHVAHDSSQVKQDLLQLQEKVQRQLTSLDETNQFIGPRDNQLDGRLLKLEISVEDLNISLKNLKFLFRPWKA